MSVDDAVVARAKRYARQRGVSVSRLVEDYLGTISEASKAEEEPPVLHSLRGMLMRGKPEDYRRHLAGKYR